MSFIKIVGTQIHTLNGWRSFKRFKSESENFLVIFERMGLHVIPVHYYSPVPDTRELSSVSALE